MTRRSRGRTASRRKVGDALDEWLSRIEHSIKPSMVQNWRNYAAYYVIPYIGQRDVQEINGAVCDALYAKVLAEGRVKARPKKRPTTNAVHVRGGLRRTAGRCRVGLTGMTPCGATTRTPRMTRRLAGQFSPGNLANARPRMPPERHSGSYLPAWSPRRSSTPTAAPPGLGRLRDLGMGQAERRQ